MKRKLLAALCITAMSAGLLAGCGSSEKAEDTSKSQETSAEDTSEQESKTDTKTDGISSILPLYTLHPINGRSISLDTGKQAYSRAVDIKIPTYPILSTMPIRYIIKSVKTKHLLKKDMPF